MMFLSSGRPHSRKSWSSKIPGNALLAQAADQIRTLGAVK